MSNETISVQPLPCPFCGGRPISHRVSGDERTGYADVVIYKCEECSCRQSACGDTSKGGYADNSKVEAQALARWNMRAEQHQGEPVGYAGRNSSGGFRRNDGYLVVAEKPEPYLDVPLYTHADPGEVERLHTELSAVKFNLDKTDKGLLAADAEVRRLRKTIDGMNDAHAKVVEDNAALRAKLAEAQEELRARDDLLSEAYQHDIGTPLKRKIRAAALSASAEPSAPCATPCGQQCPGDGVSKCKACPSVPVERDERAEFERAYKVAVDHGWSNVKHLARQLLDARAAMERKP